MPTTTAYADAVALAAARQGVVSQRQLVRAGLTPALASRAVAAGRWQRLLPGIYLTASRPPTLHQRCYAASLYGGPKSVISGAAGCGLRGLPLGTEAAAEVCLLLPQGVHRASTGFVTVVRTRQLPPGQVLRREQREDLVVAELERCVIDAVRAAADLGEARAVATRALRHRSLDWSVVAAAGSRRGSGSGHLAQVVRDVADGVRSPAEGTLHEILAPAARRRTLPPYLLNPVLYLDGELVGSPDAYFPGLGLGDEQDSRAFHGSEDQLDRTLLRHERFRTSGLLLHHATPARCQSDPAAHVTKLAGLVVERRALAEPEPSGLLVLGRGPLLPARTPWPRVPDAFLYAAAPPRLSTLLAAGNVVAR